MFDEELECLVVGRGQLAEEVSDLEEDAVELHAHLPCLGGRRPARSLHLLHDDALALLGQADEVVVVAEQDQGLRELGRVSTHKLASFYFSCVRIMFWLFQYILKKRVILPIWFSQ